MNGLASEQGQRLCRIGFGVADCVSALVVYLAVFQGLPSRYWLVDGGAVSILVLFAFAGGGLLSQAAWASKLARAASWVALVIGLLLVTTLALTASYLSGIYGPVGRGGSLILGLSAALAIPYLVLLPAAQLVWLGPRRVVAKRESVSTEA